MTLLQAAGTDGSRPPPQWAAAPVCRVHAFCSLLHGWYGDLVNPGVIVLCTKCLLIVAIMWARLSSGHTRCFCRRRRVDAHSQTSEEQLLFPPFFFLIYSKSFGKFAQDANLLYTLLSFYVLVTISKCHPGVWPDLPPYPLCWCELSTEGRGHAVGVD